MITLFHGSYISVQAPLVKLGRKKVDFGQGFYLTNLRKQAESWAKTIAERKGRNTQPAVSTFSVWQKGFAIRGFGLSDALLCGSSCYLLLQLLQVLLRVCSLADCLL